VIRFAHRGASALAPENTLAAFQAAVDQGCSWIETDLRLTADDVPVLLHDASVDRTTGGRGDVGRMPLAQVKRLDAGGWFGRGFRGERIPTLAEALEWSRGRCGLNLEIKEERRPADLIEQVAQAVRDERELDRVLFSSFRAADLRRLRAALLQARIAWLVSRTSRGLTALVKSESIAALHPKDALVSRRIVRRCHRFGLRVHVWVVNRRARLAELEAMEVDGVMTDDPRIFQA
jgi:glycerophosphoryl diester phosphodiesterase